MIIIIGQFITGDVAHFSPLSVLLTPFGMKSGSFSSSSSSFPWWFPHVIIINRIALKNLT
jgi:hypothetical protein